MPGPRPAAFSVGSSEAITTRAIPASMIASVHGGVRPVWQHGSSDTYIVAPPRSIAAAGVDRGALGVRPAELGVPALAEHPAVAHDHRADQRIRARRAAPVAGELDRAVEVLVVGGLKRAHGVSPNDIDSRVNATM